MKNPSSNMKLTYQDLLRLPDDLLRHELIDGVHIVTPAPFTKHQRVVVNLGWLLRAYLEEHPLGQVYVAPVDVWFSDVNVVEPDLLYVSRERLERQLTSKNLKGPPDLVVEVLSPSTRRRDRGLKRQLYERYGVSEYWLIDPDAETVQVCRLEAGRLDPRIELRREPGAAGPLLATPLLPGLEIPLGKLFDPPGGA